MLKSKKDREKRTAKSSLKRDTQGGRQEEQKEEQTDRRDSERCAHSPILLQPRAPLRRRLPLPPRPLDVCTSCCTLFGARLRVQSMFVPVVCSSCPPFLLASLLLSISPPVASVGVLLAAVSAAPFSLDDGDGDGTFCFSSRAHQATALEVKCRRTSTILRFGAEARERLASG